VDGSHIDPTFLGTSGDGFVAVKGKGFLCGRGRFGHHRCELGSFDLSFDQFGNSLQLQGSSSHFGELGEVKDFLLLDLNVTVEGLHLLEVLSFHLGTDLVPQSFLLGG